MKKRKTSGEYGTPERQHAKPFQAFVDVSPARVVALQVACRKAGVSFYPTSDRRPDYQSFIVFGHDRLAVRAIQKAFTGGGRE